MITTQERSSVPPLPTPPHLPSSLITPYPHHPHPPLSSSSFSSSTFLLTLRTPHHPSYHISLAVPAFVLDAPVWVMAIEGFVIAGTITALVLMRQQSQRLG